MWPLTRSVPFVVATYQSFVDGFRGIWALMLIQSALNIYWNYRLVRRVLGLSR